MVERLIKNELKLKQWRRFKRNRLAAFSAVIILIVTIVSLTAEMWANSKPIVMSYKGSIYFPAFNRYHPSVFNPSSEDFVTNYRKLDIKENGWAIWPIIHWDPYEANKTVDDYPSRPTSDNWLGTDEGGRDVMARLLYGYRYSLSYAFLVWFITTIIAIAL
ncbi:MAG: peptide ABC transporter permease, partial [Bdellovibrionales bacterium]|nr:peptide ABC transporter permease [Bdellovibrionales bacterium]